ncbi:MAG: beta-galactosidase [Anaerolineales bacterium]|nr:beta-galactosidase [Anaerolineales bacterium]
MKFGVCYYPEHWPESRWETDARMMREVGLSIVRIAEFAWSRIEPEERRFDWDWLDRAIETLADAGLQIVLGTPTAAPPAWLSLNYPDTLPVDEQGRRRNFGGRRHYCPNSLTFRTHTRRIVTAMAERYGQNPHVIGWQIDNEFGGGRTARCYCHECLGAFRVWLRHRYGALKALNEAWGTVFWSQEYHDWDQIPFPVGAGSSANPSHALDYFRFASDSFVHYQHFQISNLKSAISNQQFLTHNFMGLFFRDLDYFDLAAPLDFVSLDNYPTAGIDRVRGEMYGEEPAPKHYAYDVGDAALTAMELDLARGWKNKPFWIMEQQPGHVNWGTVNPGVRPGTVRLWTWHALAAGAETVMFFRWRAARFAQEQYHAGLLNHDASPNVGFFDLQKMVGERALMAQVTAEPVRAQVAMIFNYDDLWALQLQPHRSGFTYLRLAFTWYRALLALGISVDFRPLGAELSGYQMVLAPGLFLGSADLADKLCEYASTGGTLVLGVRSGFKTPSNLVTDEPLPGVFRDLAGVGVREWHALPTGRGYALESELSGLDGEATVWAEALTPGPSPEGRGEIEVLARYGAGPFAGEAALTVHKLRDGQVVYCGWHPTQRQAEAMIGELATRVGVEGAGQFPAGVLAFRRGRFTVVLNFTEVAQDVQVGEAKGNVPSRGVWVVENGEGHPF